MESITETCERLVLDSIESDGHQSTSRLPRFQEKEESPENQDLLDQVQQLARENSLCADCGTKGTFETTLFPPP